MAVEYRLTSPSSSLSTYLDVNLAKGRVFRYHCHRLPSSSSSSTLRRPMVETSSYATSSAGDDYSNQAGASSFRLPSISSLLAEAPTQSRPSTFATRPTSSGSASPLLAPFSSSKIGPVPRSPLGSSPWKSIPHEKDQQQLPPPSLPLPSRTSTPGREASERDALPSLRHLPLFRHAEGDSGWRNPKRSPVPSAISVRPSSPAEAALVDLDPSLLARQECERLLDIFYHLRADNRARGIQPSQGDLQPSPQLHERRQHEAIRDYIDAELAAIADREGLAISQQVAQRYGIVSHGHDGLKDTGRTSEHFARSPRGPLRQPQMPALTWGPSAPSPGHRSEERRLLLPHREQLASPHARSIVPGPLPSYSGQLPPARLAQDDMDTSMDSVGTSASSVASSARRSKAKRRVTKREGEAPACLGCGRYSTAEWRRGPTGPRTLCNACGLLFAKMAKLRKLESASNDDSTDASDPTLDELRAAVSVSSKSSGSQGLQGTSDGAIAGPGLSSSSFSSVPDAHRAPASLDVEASVEMDERYESLTSSPSRPTMALPRSLAAAHRVTLPPPSLERSSTVPSSAMAPTPSARMHPYSAATARRELTPPKDASTPQSPPTLPSSYYQQHRRSLDDRRYRGVRNAHSGSSLPSRNVNTGTSPDRTSASEAGSASRPATCPEDSYRLEASGSFAGHGDEQQRRLSGSESSAT
ncbi:unnamed protein product [Jaminaea pallidilutea]